MKPDPTPASEALRDEYPGIWYWEDDRWEGPLGLAIEAAARAEADAAAYRASDRGIAELAAISTKAHLEGRAEAEAESRGREIMAYRDGLQVARATAEAEIAELVKVVRAARNIRSEIDGWDGVEEVIRAVRALDTVALAATEAEHE